MTTFNAGSIEASLDLDVDPFQRGLKWARAEGKKFAGERYAAKLDVDTREASGHLAVIHAELARVAGSTYSPRVELDGGAATIAELVAIQQTAARIDGHDYKAKVNVSGTAEALAEIRLLHEQLDSLSRTSGQVDVSAGASSLMAASGGAQALGGGLASALFSMQGLIALVALFAPAIVAAFAAATAAVGGFVAAFAAAGGGIIAFAAAAIGNITKVLGAQKTLTTGAQSYAASQTAVNGAEQALADARRNRAQSVANAETSLAQAEHNAVVAQAALNQERTDAVQRLKDYRDQLRGSELDETAAELAVRRARIELERTLKDPTSTKLDRDEARNSLAQAVFGLHQAREGRDQLQAQAKKARDEGVRGDAQVVAARDRLAAANAAVKQAEQQLANARRNGAEQVAKAQQALATATTAATTAGSKQAAALNAVSTPAAKAFLGAVGLLKTGWNQFLDATQGPALGVVTRFLTDVGKWLPTLAPVANAAAGAVDDLLGSFEGWANGGGLKAFTHYLTRQAPGFIRDFGHILGNLAIVFGNTVKAFTPFAHHMIGALSDVTGAWADSSKSFAHSDGIKGFIKYVREVGPDVLGVLGGVSKVFVTIGRAIAPAALPVLKAVRWMLDGFNGLSSAQVRMLLLATGAILAFTVAPVAGTALAVVALVAAIGSMGDGGAGVASSLAPLAGMLGDLRDVAVQLAPVIGGELRDAWAKLQPALSDLGDTIRTDLAPQWHAFWHAAEPVLEKAIHLWFPVLADVLRTVIKVLNNVVRGFSGMLEIVTGIMSGDWSKVWDGAKKIFSAWRDNIRDIFMGLFSTIADFIKNSPIGKLFSDMWDDIKTNIAATKDWVLDHLVRGDDSLMGRLKSGFSDAMDAIGVIWDKLQKAAGTPVKFVVDYAYNRGIVPVVNAIPGVDDIHTVDTTGWPSFATGGVLPGYTPGRDVHRFVSPTGGVLNLSGGEGILIPQATRALGGAPGIAALNAAARTSSFAGGGVMGRISLPSPGDLLNGAKDVAGDAVKGAKKFADVIRAVGSLVKDAPGWLDTLDGGGEWGGMLRDMLRSTVNGGLRGVVNGIVPGNPMPNVFDTGGWLMPGQTGVNLSSRPEPVFSDAQWRVLAGGGSTGGGMTPADVDRIVRAIEENRGVYAEVSSRAELEDAYEAIGRELRK